MAVSQEDGTTIYIQVEIRRYSTSQNQTNKIKIQILASVQIVAGSQIIKTLLLCLNIILLLCQ